MNHKNEKVKKRTLSLSSSLADEFAKTAMQGMMVNFGPDDDYTVHDIARISYEIAHEMMQARRAYRQKKKSSSQTQSSAHPPEISLTN